MHDHCVIDLNHPPRFRCQHCGVERELPLPMPILEVNSAAKVFMKVHRGCPADATASARICAAIDRCFAASPAAPTTGDIAAAVLWAASEGLEHHWDGAECVDHLQALAAQLNGTDYRGEVQP